MRTHPGLLSHGPYWWDAARVLVAGHTPATAVRREANAFIVETPRGRIAAAAVVVIN